jgi:phosphate transport system substrate-binding protein
MKQNPRTVLSCIGILALTFGLALGGCRSDTLASEGELKGTLAVSGAWALYPMMVRWGEEFQAQHPGVQFDISAGGAGKGMADVLGGAVDIGMVSREIYPEEIDQGAWWAAVTKDAVVPTLSSDNPCLARILAQGITRETLAAIWTGQTETWGQVVGDPAIQDEIHVYTRSDACGAATTWAAYLGDYQQEDLQGVAVYGDPGLATAVSDDPLGIGYNNLNFAYDADTDRPVAKIQIAPLDLDENGQVDEEERFYDTKTDLTAAIADGRYPAPPARDLYLVTLDTPDGLAKAFIAWVLTDGQAFVDEVGYIQLGQAQLEAQLEKLNGTGAEE